MLVFSKLKFTLNVSFIEHPSWADARPRECAMIRLGR